MGLLHLHIDGKVFRDSHNREVTLRGINVAGDAKYPKSPDLPSFVSDKFFEGDDVSFVGRPFSLEDAHMHFKRLRKWGYNTIRYIFTWEAIEHSGPGKYDDEWVTFTIEVLRIAKQYEFYVFMDPHQDVVSRYLRLIFHRMQSLHAHSSGLGCLVALEHQCGLCMLRVWTRRASRRPKPPLSRIHTIFLPNFRR